MQRTIVLDVCTATYDDRSGIPSHNSVVPDACTLLYGDIADDHCARGDKYVFGDGRHNTFIWQDRHDCSFFHWLCAARHRRRALPWPKVLVLFFVCTYTATRFIAQTISSRRW